MGDRILFNSVWQNRVKSVSHPTEPANYTGSYIRIRKRIVDTEIAMHQGSRRTVIITTLQMLSLLRPKASEEQEGSLRN
jgi:hypothetical protein